MNEKGYVHPEVLVSTAWVAEHLNDPAVRVVESNEDIMLYDINRPSACRPKLHQAHSRRGAD